MDNQSEINSNIQQIKFAIDVRPTFAVDRRGGFIKRGKDNDYFDKLLSWRSNEPMHGAIVAGKARYVAGVKITAKNQSTTTDLFLAKANPSESWHAVIKKLSDDEATCGGYFLKRITNILGVPIHNFHLSFSKCCVSDCGQYVLYSESGKWNQGDYIPIPVWKGSGVGTFVDVYKRYYPSSTWIDSVYPKPEYEAALLDIDTATRIKTYYNTLVRNNFNPGNIVTVRNGENDKEKQSKLSKKIKGQHSGEDEVGNVIVIFASKDSNTTEVTTLGANDLDKQYQEVGKVGQQNIIVAHGVNPILFKIKTEGQLGGRTELVEAHELFINEYVKPKQEIYKELLKYSYKQIYSTEEEFEFEQVQPIGSELPLDNQAVVTALNAKDPNIITNYIIEKYALKIPEKLDATGAVVKEASVNDNLKGLSAAENADVIRIVRDFQKGRNGMNEAMALHRIASYGVSDQEARKWLGLGQQVQQSSQDKNTKFFELFKKYAHEINFNDEILEIHPVKFNSMADALRFEGVKFKDYVNNKDLNDAVLNQIKANPSVTPKEISKILRIDVPQVDEITKLLEKSGLVTSGSGTLTPTEKGINKVTDNSETEIYTEYVYDLREPKLYAGRENIEPESNGKLLTTSHQFCKDMILENANKALTFEAIFSLENEFGESAWDFRGGFTTHKSGITDPWCNHVWSAVTKIRKNK